MDCLTLGDALQQITTQLSDRVKDALIIDTELLEQYTLSVSTEVYNMESYVYVRSDWLQAGQRSGIYLMGRISSNPLLVVWTDHSPEPEPVETDAQPALPVTAVELEHEGHRFDPLDMFWRCECDETLEADARVCPSCGASNPFLGLMI